MGDGERPQSWVGPAGAAPGSEGSGEPVKVSELGNDPFVAGGVKKDK